MAKEYIDPKDLEDVLTIREKAERHLRKWSKKMLIQHLAFASKDGWLEKWAEEYDKEALREHQRDN